MAYKVILDPRALSDIQQAIDYYDGLHVGLGKKFEAVLHKHFLSLEKNPFFRMLYQEVRGLPLKKYPYMIHFTIEESLQEVVVRAVLHTSQDPESWKQRNP